MTALMVQGVTKRFLGVTALDDVHVDARPGEVLGLVGPNGAGKTTLVNVITGHFGPDEGAVTLGEQTLTGAPIERIARCGVARTYQHMRLLEGYSVIDNVLAGRHQAFKGRVFQLWRVRRREEREQRAATRELLDRLGLGDVADVSVSSLSYGRRRRVEIARALAAQPSVMLLDEPTAGMTPAEAKEIGELIRSTSREGLAVVLIEHNVALVSEVCDRIAVLDWGKVIKLGTPDEVWADAKVRAAYLGGELL
ncbi:ABC transporter ATP-binding protein [Solirubrobacter ginsenosidimutans]|uniref:ABC transporter ATP-binding protein n=1 Tax=Solirubrobacter ginsenosidimutans TaxID=490573 RepID=A0A9X3MR66_9ACTN|nr:ABC transporter ATP-binding protein [Solirubrobacter ginsenosidimutans]MDA0160312.1 ABC transporter ATP-binding protein [Solirubrobacter ginsenosidimutans]